MDMFTMPLIHWNWNQRHHLMTIHNFTDYVRRMQNTNDNTNSIHIYNYHHQSLLLANVLHFTIKLVRRSVFVAECHDSKMKRTCINRTNQWRYDKYGHRSMSDCCENGFCCALVSNKWDYQKIEYDFTWCRVI